VTTAEKTWTRSASPFEAAEPQPKEKNVKDIYAIYETKNETRERSRWVQIRAPADGEAIKEAEK
jgi:hypothetical protein